MNQIGIMMGRLSPPISNRVQSFPINSWKNDLSLAKSCGFETIEWVFDDLQPNPIISIENLSEIKSTLVDNDISINSVCADYFMINKLFNVSEFELSKNLDTLTTLIHNCHTLNIDILELPFVDSSSIQNENYQLQTFANINKILSEAENYDIKITLETDLSPIIFKNFLDKFNHPNIRANYDIGNSISNGYDPNVELFTYGEFISNVHIKDRKYHGSTVPLGKGDVDFELFFSILSQINYDGDLIIQGAREDLYDSSITPESTCKKYLKFVNEYVDIINDFSRNHNI